MSNTGKKGKLNIFTSALKVTLPYVITTTSAVVIVKMFGGGLPFIKDDIVKYKYYDIKGSSNGIIDVSESYKSNMDIKDNNEYEIITYSPWKKEDNGYQREISRYYFDIVDDKYMYNAFFVCDESYFKTKSKNIESEIEVSSIKPSKYKESICEGEIVFLDSNDSLVNKESDVRNYVITFTELLLSGLTGFAASQIIKGNKKEDSKIKKLELKKTDGYND